MPTRATSLPLLVAALILSAAAISPASAEREPPFCASAQAALAKDAALARATAAVFPRLPRGRTDSACVYPFALLHYADADVLLTTAARPGEACHGCAAMLSAFVLAPAGPGGRLVASFKGFTEAGTFGDPGRMTATRLAGHDTIAIESGGTFQGYTSSGLALFMFDSGKLMELKPSLDLASSNEGALGDTRKAVNVDGAWRVDPAGTIRIDYKVKAGGRTTRAFAAWRVAGGRLVLVEGKVPKEIVAGAGRE